MSEETRPSLMSPREKVEHHTATGSLPETIPGLLDRLEVNAEARERMRDGLESKGQKP